MPWMQQSTPTSRTTHGHHDPRRFLGSRTLTNWIVVTDKTVVVRTKHHLPHLPVEPLEELLVGIGMAMDLHQTGSGKIVAVTVAIHQALRGLDRLLRHAITPIGFHRQPMMVAGLRLHRLVISHGKLTIHGCHINYLQSQLRV